MDLFLVRHAIAEERRIGLDDADRELTDIGRSRFSRMVQDLARGQIRLDRIYTSPWTRAAQTADLLAELSVGETVRVDGLAKPPTPELFASLQGESIACVGHEPWISDALALLTVGQTPGPWIRFKKGAIAWLRGEPRPARMHLRALWIWKGH